MIVQDLIHDLFPDYNAYIFSLQYRGDEKITCISYCVLIKKGLSNISVDPVEIGNTRNALEIDVSGTKILVAYLEYADHEIRYQQLKNILSYNVDIVCGDLNTFFRDVRREYFESLLQIISHWKQIGLYLASKVVRNMHVPRRVLSDRGWILMSNGQYSFPLPFFWKTFLKTPLLKSTGWIWTAIFNSPVLDPDNVVAKNFEIFIYPPIIIKSGEIEEASDHGAIYFAI
ncbi:MAG: hypothetical protein WD512_03165 [Candidatus Paceibacterota bacterium]